MVDGHCLRFAALVGTFVFHVKVSSRPAGRPSVLAHIATEARGTDLYEI